MLDILLLSTFSVLWIMGVSCITSEDQPFHFIRRWFERREHVLLKPVILCSRCMSSLHTWLWLAVFIDGEWWQYLLAALTAPILTFGAVFWLTNVMVEE